MTTSFDRVKIGICLPTTGVIHSPCAMSLTQLIGVLATQKLYPESTRQELMVVMKDGSNIAGNRRRLVENALAGDCTHILFVDSDMRFDVGAFLLLARRRLPLVAVNYRRRCPPAEFLAATLDYKIMPTTAASVGLEPCDYTGFGLALIERRVFDVLAQPWFLCEFNDGVETSEDVGFFRRARAAGFTGYVDHDASKLVGHIGALEYRWDQTYDNLPPG